MADHNDPAKLMKKTEAEFLGTFWPVLGGCGAAVLAAKVPETGIGFLGVALALHGKCQGECQDAKHLFVRRQYGEPELNTH